MTTESTWPFYGVPYRNAKCKNASIGEGLTLHAAFNIGEYMPKGSENFHLQITLWEYKH